MKKLGAMLLLFSVTLLGACGSTVPQAASHDRDAVSPQEVSEPIADTQDKQTEPTQAPTYASPEENALGYITPGVCPDRNATN